MRPRPPVTDSPQVDKSHYDFARYMTKRRWASLWHQLDEINRLRPERTLEIGPGASVLKPLARQFAIDVETLDLDPELAPDHVGSITSLPFADNAFDAVCAFQVLEHLPYESSLQGFREMARVSRRHLLISLPDARVLWLFQAHIPKLGAAQWLVPRPALGAKSHVFDGEHHWEINKKGFPLDRIIADFGAICRLTRTYRVPENPYHRFFVFEKQ